MYETTLPADNGVGSGALTDDDSLDRYKAERDIGDFLRIARRASASNRKDTREAVGRMRSP